jgi:hypothetical protein
MLDFKCKQNSFEIAKVPTNIITAKVVGNYIDYISVVDDSTFLTLNELCKVKVWCFRTEMILQKEFKIKDDTGTWEAVVVGRKVFILGVQALHVLDLDSEQKQRYKFKEEFNGVRFYSHPMLHATKEQVMITCDHHIDVFSHEGKRYPCISIDSTIYTICAMDEDLLIGTDTGLFKHNCKNGQSTLIVQQSIFSVQYFSDVGIIAISTLSKELMLYNTKTTALHVLIDNKEMEVESLKKLGKIFLSVSCASSVVKVYNILTHKQVHEYNASQCCPWSQDHLIISNSQVEIWQ